MSAPSAAPTPMPAFAPVARPERGGEGDDEGAGRDVVDVGEVEGDDDALVGGGMMTDADSEEEEEDDEDDEEEEEEEEVEKKRCWVAVASEKAIIMTALPTPPIWNLSTPVSQQLFI